VRLTYNRNLLVDIVMAIITRVLQVPGINPTPNTTPPAYIFPGRNLDKSIKLRHRCVCIHQDHEDEPEQQCTAEVEKPNMKCSDCERDHARIN
jgi:hypothetical protein